MSKPKVRRGKIKSPKIDNRLKYYRRRCGYTQSRVAYLIGVKPEQISNWERGERYPCLVNAIKLSKKYYQSISLLFPDLDAAVEKGINEKILQAYEESMLNNP